MPQPRRILIVGREQEATDRLTRLLEAAGCIVTSTLNDEVAIDLAGSSEYDALLVGQEVPDSDGRYVATQARNRRTDLVVIPVRGLQAVMTQLRQAGVTP